MTSTAPAPAELPGPSGDRATPTRRCRRTGHESDRLRGDRGDRAADDVLCTKTLVPRDFFEKLIQALDEPWPRNDTAVLLAKLALDIRLRRKGLGGALLATVLTRCLAAGELAAARYVVTDAIDDRAMNFNRRYTFVLIPGTNRLVRPIKDIADELRRG